MIDPWIFCDCGIKRVKSYLFLFMHDKEKVNVSKKRAKTADDAPSLHPLDLGLGEYA